MCNHEYNVCSSLCNGDCEYIDEQPDSDSCDDDDEGDSNNNNSSGKGYSDYDIFHSQEENFDTYCCRDAKYNECWVDEDHCNDRCLRACEYIEGDVGEYCCSGKVISDRRYKIPLPVKCKSKKKYLKRRA